MPNQLPYRPSPFRSPRPVSRLPQQSDASDLLDTYCGPYSLKHKYRPMFVPLNVGLLRPPPRVRPFGNNTIAIPLMRVEDSGAIQFYYFGEGCSDMYVFVNNRNALIAYDRIDALRQLAPRNKMTSQLSQHCTHQMETAGFQLLPGILARNSFSVSDVASLHAVVTGSGCLNNYLHVLMKNKGIGTLVLNYESPGNERTGADVNKKIEIIHLGEELYDAMGDPCILKKLNGCYYCLGSVLSFATCNGTLGSVPVWLHNHSLTGAAVLQPRV